MDHRHQHRLQLQDHRPRYDSWQQVFTDNILAPGGSIGYRDQDGSLDTNKVPSPHLRGFHVTLVATPTSDFNTDPGYCRTTDPDMALSPALGLDVTTVLGGSTSHPDRHDSSNNMTFRHQHGSRWTPSPRKSTRPVMATGTTDINTDTGYRRAVDLDMAPSCSSGPDFIM